MYVHRGLISRNLNGPRSCRTGTTRRNRSTSGQARRISPQVTEPPNDVENNPNAYSEEGLFRSLQSYLQHDPNFFPPIPSLCPNTAGYVQNKRLGTSTANQTRRAATLRRKPLQRILARVPLLKIMVSRCVRRFNMVSFTTSLTPYR
jgi:hypothetical protein